MDAADRAELDALRRRAYGPSADIHDDPARPRAADRARGSRARPEVADGARAAPAPEPSSRSSPNPSTESVAPEAVARPAPPHRLAAHCRGAHGALLTSAVAVAAIVVAVALLQPPAASRPPHAERTPTRPCDETAVHLPRRPRAPRRLMTISLDSSFGNYVDLPTDGAIPHSRRRPRSKWAMPLGRVLRVESLGRGRRRFRRTSTASSSSAARTCGPGASTVAARPPEACRSRSAEPTSRPSELPSGSWQTTSASGSGGCATVTSTWCWGRSKRLSAAPRHPATIVSMWSRSRISSPSRSRRWC